MKFCQSHWDRLRAAIEERGLSDLVAEDGRAAADRIQDQLLGTNTVNDFDPLMSAHWAICTQFVKDVGLDALQGEVCPLCSVASWPGGETRDQNWVDGASNEALAYARFHRLVPEPS